MAARVETRHKVVNKKNHIKITQKGASILTTVMVLATQGSKPGFGGETCFEVVRVRRLTI
jgi:hypothetical protein